MSDETLKIEDLRIGMLVDCVEYQWSLHPAMTGARVIKIDGIDQTVTLGSYLVHVAHLRRHVTVDESPKEAPIQFSSHTNPSTDIVTSNGVPATLQLRRACTGPLSIGDTQISQITLKQAATLAAFLGHWANPNAFGTAKEMLETVEMLIERMEGKGK